MDMCDWFPKACSRTNPPQSRLAQKRCGRKTNNRVKEPVDSFVFLVCVVFIAGCFQGVFADFLAVFPVLWFLGYL